MTSIEERKIRRIAVIPARGGSKRLPHKNIIDFKGKPIITYTIVAALQTGLFQRVVVSTEDAEIAQISKSSGAEIAERSMALAGDEARVVDVCLDLLNREQADGRLFDVLCCLYATSPLRSAEDITQTVRLIKPGICDFAMAVTEYDYPPHQALVRGSEGLLTPMWPDLVGKRSQQVGEFLVDNGSTYAVYVPGFREYRTFYGPNLVGYYMPRYRSTDIDVADDLILAELLAERMGL